MAIAFELVINYGSNHNAAAAARHAALNHPPLTAGPHQVGLHKPLLGTVRGYDGKQYLEMAVLPVGVGWKVGLDRHAPHLGLTADELSELGKELYQLLTRFTGYRAAQVGWDPEGRVDPAELQQEWAEELAAGELPGLVLAEDLHQQLRGQGFVPFAPGFVWIPYEGEHPSSLTIDGDNA
ncbi:hypothetical protein [Micromonospora chersina]|uniref:hypothetical protein n=1 Tax=Micromonospora chersina TaxID=47854 RepID=UPI0033BA0BBC